MFAISGYPFHIKSLQAEAQVSRVLQVSSMLQVAQHSTEEAETGTLHHDLMSNKTVQESGVLTSNLLGHRY